MSNKNSSSIEILDENEVQSFDGNQSETQTEAQTELSDQETMGTSYGTKSRSGKSAKSPEEIEAQKERRRLGALKAKITREKNKKLREQREKLALRQIIGPTADDPESEDDWYHDTEEEEEEIDPEDMVYYHPPETGYHRAPRGRSDKLSKKEKAKREKKVMSTYKPVLKQMTNRDIKTSQMEVKLKELMSQNKKLKKKMHEIEKKTPQMIVQVPTPAVQPPPPTPVPEAKRVLANGLIDFFAR
jgi:hypothetical protein